MPEKYIPTELRRLVAERARRGCEYCLAQTQYSADSFTVNHITLRSLDRPTTAENLALCCHGCNQPKSDCLFAPDSGTGALVWLCPPRDQHWVVPCAGKEDCPLVMGLTPTGRATHEAWHRDRPGLMNLRRVLYAIGEHPPKLEIRLYLGLDAVRMLSGILSSAILFACTSQPAPRTSPFDGRLLLVSFSRSVTML